MADQQHRTAGAMQLAVALLTSFLEPGIADGKDLVENQHIPNRTKRHRIGEPRGHTARIMAVFQLRKTLETRERQDLRRGAPQLSETQTHHSSE